MIIATMESSFLATYIFTFVVGVALGFLTYWIFEKDNKKEK